MRNFHISFARNIVSFGLDNTLSSYTDNQKNDFLVLVGEPTKGINDNIGAAEKNLALTLVRQIQNFS